VRAGLVRCARGAACKFAEQVGEEWVGGFILGRGISATRMVSQLAVRSIAPVIVRRRCDGGGFVACSAQEKKGASGEGAFLVETPRSAALVAYLVRGRARGDLGAL
jgi:hypothetical protein